VIGVELGIAAIASTLATRLARVPVAPEHRLAEILTHPVR